MTLLKVERVGGFAGFGLSGSRLRSQGEQEMSALSAADQAAVEALFRNRGRVTAAGPQADGFRYRITRVAGGQEETVEVPEAAVPAALRNCVTDTLT